jgi:hypothetical protein
MPRRFASLRGHHLRGHVAAAALGLDHDQLAVASAHTSQGLRNVQHLLVEAPTMSAYMVPPSTLPHHPDDQQHADHERAHGGQRGLVRAMQGFRHRPPRWVTHRECTLLFSSSVVTDVSAPGRALFALTGSATSKLGLRKKKMRRHSAARPIRIGKKAQSESSPPVRGWFPSSEGGTSGCISALMPKKLVLHSKVPALTRIMRTVGNHTKARAEAAQLATLGSRMKPQPPTAAARYRARLALGRVDTPCWPRSLPASRCASASCPMRLGRSRPPSKTCR